jgi:hypothetical protein
MLEISANRILFSPDWPFENIDPAAFNAAMISASERLKDRAPNVARLFKIAL